MAHTEEKTVSIGTLWQDELTGIYNRKAFLAKAAEMLREQEPGYYVLVCFDIDKFKVINDQYGTDQGDMVLKYIASAIQEGMDEIGGICSRFDADDFALLYPRSAIDSDSVKKIHDQVKEYGKDLIPISGSIGRYIVDNLALQVSGMYDRALLAMNSVKGDFERHSATYDESMRTKLLMEQEIVSEMQEALDKGQFEPWFQPQYNHATGAIVGAEALVRWRHPVKGLVPPYVFIPIFERNGFIYELDKYIWEQSCMLLRRWIDEGKEPLPVSVNVSRYDALREDFFETITGIVHKYDIPSKLFRMEITESAFTEASEQLISVIKKLIENGFTLEIDDFGSGYSSLNTLKDVPAQVLKLDMKFFSKTGNADRSGNIVVSIIRMAKWLGMAVIAEGVEEKEQADYLKSIGCYYIQGYYYAKPMPVVDYEKLFTKSQKEPQMTRLQTLETLDNNEFWNPKSMETLIFNSYVGGACIFEYDNGQLELLRTNDRYKLELGNLAPEGDLLNDMRPIPYMGEENKVRLIENIKNAVQTQRESSCELMLSGVKNHKTHVEYIRTTVRVIAKTEEQYLLYCVIVNTTERHLAEQERIKAEKKELESAIRLQVIMENINGGVSAIIIHEDGTSMLCFSNDKYYELYGYTKEQALEEQLDVMTTILPEDFPTVLEKVNRLKKDKVPVVIDYRITKRDGKVAYLRANASLMYMEGYGEVITSVISDVTEIISLQDQLRAIVENINGGVTATVIRNGKPEFIVVNDQFYKMLGYATREEYDRALPDKYTGVHPEDRERIIRQFESSDEEKYTMEYRIIRKDGEVRYIRNNISVVYLFGIDEPVKLSVANDVTDIMIAQQKEKEYLRKREETTLQNYKREMQLREEVMKDSISYYQLNITEGVIEEYHSVNSTQQEIKNGDQINEELRKKILDGIVKEDHESVRNTLFAAALFNAYRQGKTTVSVKFRSIVPGKGIRWTKGTASIMERYQSCALIAFIENKDIDVQMKDQLAISAIMDEEIESVAVVDVDSGIAHFAQLSIEFTTMRVDESFNYQECFMEMVHKDIVEEDQKAAEKFFDIEEILKALQQENIIKHLFRVRTPKGVVLHKKTRAFFVDDTHKEIAIIGRDITDLYEEEQRRHHELQEAADVANKANKAKSEFLSRMSHDMRTPLNAILSLSNADILQHADEEQHVQYLNKIHYAGEYLSEIISDILDMSRIEQNKMTLNPSPYSYHDFLQIIEDVVTESCREKNIRFVMNFDGVNTWIMTDKVRFNQIFVNLLTNAVKFTNPGGCIEFISNQLPSSEDGIENRQFIIRDNGIGMDQEFIKRAFEHFEQENREQVAETDQGTGLGLPIVKSIVELMNGTIQLESEKDKGTMVTLELPLQVVEEPVQEAEQEFGSLRGIRILLCEDNELNVEITRMLLENQGCIIDSAENGKIGLEMFEKSEPGHYQVILMDIRMPVMNGYLATKEIRNLNRKDAGQIPIIALSAEVYSEDIEATTDAGMSAYISKPIDEKLLFKTLRQLVLK